MTSEPAMNARIIFCLFLFLLCQNVLAQNGGRAKKQKHDPWEMQNSGVEASLRGLHVLNDNIIWASGTGGTVLRTLNSGETWTSKTVAGAEELDFRDIHAFSGSSAVILSAGTPARVYRTNDGGETWAKTFEHQSEKAFFDALSFWNDDHGIAMSDPIDDRLLLIKTNDGGKSWSELKPENRPKVIPGEGGFAASGTNMVLLKNGTCLIALGSAKQDEQFKVSRIAISPDHGESWKFVNAPLPRNQSSGIFSMAFANNLIGVAVGGDYLQPERKTGNVAVTIDGGITWKTPSGKLPTGYRSGVAANRSGKQLIFVAVGPTGTDWSKNTGFTWSKVSDEAFHAIQFSPTGNTGWATGANGRIGKWSSPDR